MVVLIVAVYGQTVFSSFHFDDRSSILMNPVLKSGSGTIGELWHYWPTRVITTFTFFLNYRTCGLEPFGYHLVNLLIHIANSILVYFILLYSSDGIRSRPADPWNWSIWAGALIFALHPVQTQAVTYIAQRAASLAVAFYLSGFLLYILATKYKGSKLCFCLAWLAGGAAMFCKEMAVTFPLAVILWDCIFAGNNTKSRSRRWLIFLVLIIVIPLTVQVYSNNPRYNDSNQIESGETSPGFEPIMGGVKAPDRITYALTQIRVMVTYIRLIILPIGQNLDYDQAVFSSFLEPEIILSSILILSLLFLAFLLRKKNIAGAAFGIFFFFLALLPESGLIPIRDLIFEHRLYLPFLGLAFMVARIDFSSRRVIFLSGTIIIFFSVLTFARNRVWLDEITLWTDTVMKSPGKARPRNNLGYLFNQEGEYDRARQILSRAIEITPDYPEAMVNLAISYKNLETLSRAEEICRRALEIKSAYPEGHNTLGDILRLQERPIEAEEEYRRAIELNPGLSAARNNLANLYREMGKPGLAETLYSQALKEGEENPVYLNNIGLSLLDRGRIDDAIRSFRRAITRNPELAPAHYNLGNALFAAGDLEGTRDSFRRAIKVDHRYSRAFFNLGVVESKLGNWDDALSSFLSVLKIEPDNAGAHLKAGLIYSLIKNNPRKGTPHLRRVLELNPGLPERERIEKLLNLSPPPAGIN
ncbi:MAG: tetratricopeptide repeat protein [Candidatus Auribacterota bacterium]|nr:tetratricopeptide repeat protein [Candidatus Auribacterota bacterium]